MMDQILRFHHMGMAVRQSEKARASLLSLGYRIGEAVHDSGQKAQVQMCHSAKFPDIELIYSESQDSPIHGLTKLQDEIMYHVCFETPSIDAAVAQWRASGTRVFRVKPEMPAPLFDNRLVAFYHVAGFGLVELLEEA